MSSEGVIWRLEKKITVEMMRTTAIKPLFVLVKTLKDNHSYVIGASFSKPYLYHLKTQDEADSLSEFSRLCKTEDYPRYSVDATYNYDFDIKD